MGDNVARSNRFKRHIIDDGFEIKLMKPLYKIPICEYQASMTIITKAVAEIQTNQDLANPDAKPKLKCYLSLSTLRGQNQKNKRRISAQLEDGVFYWKGKELDASNNREVAQLVATKMQEISQ
jgi:hypothetical protein